MRYDDCFLGPFLLKVGEITLATEGFLQPNPSTARYIKMVKTT